MKNFALVGHYHRDMPLFVKKLTPDSIMRILALLIAMASVHSGTAYAQSTTVNLTTGHDPNIFQNYAPLSDQTYGCDIGIDKDFNFDRLSIGVGYYGSFQLFRDLSTRNYSVHQVLMNASCLFGSDPDDESVDAPDSSDEDPDTNFILNTASTAALKASISVQDTVPNDSLRHILFGTIMGSQQYDKQEFSLYDNSAIGGSLTYRFPFGKKLSVRASANLLYHNYPNLQAITSTDNIFSFMIGATNLPVKWIGAGIHLGIKQYPTSTTLYDTIVVGKSGHGKLGGGSGLRVHQYDFVQPSVSQILYDVNFDLSLFGITAFHGQFTYFAHPNREARLLANTYSNGMSDIANEGILVSLNDIYDDHYAYDGTKIEFNLEQKFPFDVMLTAKVEYMHKTYTGPAYNQLDSIVASNRIDDRDEEVVGISRTFPFSPMMKLRPNLEFHFLRNSSNAEYYNFAISKVTFGLEFNF
jgi:hypothetical protein